MNRVIRSMYPSGPFAVGVADLAAVSPAPDVAPDVARLAARLFYPCKRSWTEPCPWIPHINYARGYIDYVARYVTDQSWITKLFRIVITILAWAVGITRLLPVYYHASANQSVGRFPLVVFSHGVAGTRNSYSRICIDLASEGYVVVALEHSDGSASTARLPRLPGHQPEAGAGVAAAAAGASAAAVPPGRGSSGGPARGSEWCFYVGLGDKPEQLRRTRHRVAELHAVFRLMKKLNEGRLKGSVVSELPGSVAASLRGRLDLSRAAVVGHSLGGATAAAAAAELGCFKAAISLDPRWDCYGDEWPVVKRWVAPPRPPLLVIGSDEWNTPNAEGHLNCGRDNRERVLAAAAAGGGGAVLVVPRGSTHSNFDDLQLQFAPYISLLMGIQYSMEACRYHRINMWCILHFLTKHLPPPPPPKKGKAAAGSGSGLGSRPGTKAGGGAGAGQGAAARPLQRGDLEPYKKHVGDWLAELRLVTPTRRV